MTYNFLDFTVIRYYKTYYSLDMLNYILSSIEEVHD